MFETFGLTNNCIIYPDDAGKRLKILLGFLKAYNDKKHQVYISMSQFVCIIWKNLLAHG